MLQVARAVRLNWQQIGLYLGFEMADLAEYELKEPKNLHERLLLLLEDWKNREEQPTVGALISACTKAKVGGKAKRVLNVVEEK